MNAQQANEAYARSQKCREAGDIAGFKEAILSLPAHFVVATSPSAGCVVVGGVPIGPPSMPLDLAFAELKEIGEKCPLITYNGVFYNEPCELAAQE
jgi:hypothetical protein